MMQLTIKYWNNSNPTTTFVPLEVKDYNEMKAKTNKLIDERQDIDHLVIYQGNMQVAYFDRMYKH